MEHWLNVHETHCYMTKEKEFNAWYNDIHLPDVIETPGYIGCTRYQIKEFKKGRGSYLALYELATDDIDSTIRTRLEKGKREIAAGRGSDLWVGVWPFVFFRRTIRRESHGQKARPGKAEVDQFGGNQCSSRQGERIQ